MRGRPSLGIIGGPFCTTAAAVDGPAGVVVVMFVVAIVDVQHQKC
jgi:hypothetical protein